MKEFDGVTSPVCLSGQELLCVGCRSTCFRLKLPDKPSARNLFGIYDMDVEVVLTVYYLLYFSLVFHYLYFVVWGLEK